MPNKLQISFSLYVKVHYSLFIPSACWMVFLWCDAFPQEVLFYFIFLFTDVIGCLLFAATLRLCSCPC